MILNDREISELAYEGMIDPFVNAQIRTVNSNRVISYGVSSFGYDIRLANTFMVFTPDANAVIDPKRFEETAGHLERTICDEIIIPPNSFILAHSVEYIRMPEDVIAIALGKSTYARCGIVANMTPLEPGWEGHITLEFANTTSLPVKMYANEGCAQLLFYKGERPMVTYGDKQGKYQGQKSITTAKV